MMNNQKINNYKDSLIEKEEKECTFFPKLNDNYNNRHVHRIKTNMITTINGNSLNDIQVIKEEFEDDNIYNRNQKWQNNVSKKKNFIKLVNKSDEKYSFIPSVNKKKNLNLIFGDKDYYNYWLKRNKHYIHRHLKFINCNKNINDNNNNIELLAKNNDDLIKKNNKNKMNNSLDFIEQRIPIKININYIKKMLHEELQNTKSDDENESNQYLY